MQHWGLVLVAFAAFWAIVRKEKRRYGGRKRETLTLSLHRQLDKDNVCLRSLNLV